MSKSKLEDRMALLLELLTDDLVAKLQSGAASGQDKRVALDLLKANGITTEDLTALTEAAVEFNEDDLDGAPLNVIPFAHKREASGDE